MNAAPAPHDTPDHALAQQLSASLHAHLDPVGARSDLAAGAQARSRRIRRNHHVALVSAVAVAALAVATPLTVAGMRGIGTPVIPANSTTPPSTTPPAPSTTTGPTTAPPTTTGRTQGTPTGGTGTQAAPPPVTTTDNNRPPLRSVTLSAALPSGPAPDTAWTLDQTLHAAGLATPLAVGRDWTYTALAGGTGVLVDTTWATGGTIRVIRADGTTVRQVLDVPGEHGAQVVANQAGTRFVAYVTDPSSKRADALISAFDASGKPIATKHNLRHDAELAGIDGDRVFLANQNTGRSLVWDLTTNVITPYTESGLIRAVNGTQHLAALWTPSADFTRGCTEILDITGAPVTVARSCGSFYPRSFSPDGTRLAGFPVGTDGFGALQADVLDVRTGRVSLRVKGLTPHFAFLRDGTLGIEYVDRYGLTGTTNSLVACTVGGSCRRFTDAVTMADDTTRYRLPR